VVIAIQNFLTRINFPINSYTFASLLDKYSKTKSVFRNAKILKCLGIVGHIYAHSPHLWHQPRVANCSHAWSQRLRASTPTIPLKAAKFSTKGHKLCELSTGYSREWNYRTSL